MTKEQFNELIRRRPNLAARDPVGSGAVKRELWTETEVTRLREYYANTPHDVFDLSPLAIELGRTYAAVALKASELKLCSYTRPKSDAHTAKMAANNKKRSETPEERKRLSKMSQDFHANNEHPKGFKGHKRTPEERAKISASAKAMWADPNHKVNSPEHRQRISDWSSKKQATFTSENCFSRTKKGIRPDMPGIHFRSSWEANYARYLNWMKANGEIKFWEYEPMTFWFEKIKRGCRSWKPDFLVINGERTEYHEVKGWMYPRSITALRRMKKYHPEIIVILIDQHRYKALAKTMKHLIPNWE